MTYQTLNKIEKLNQEIQKLTLEKNELSEKINAELTQFFQQMDFQEHEFLLVIGGLLALKKDLHESSHNNESHQDWIKNGKKFIQKMKMKSV